jgi:hypothetical protein
MAYQPTILPPLKDERKPRTCLRCDRLFLSRSPANRLCKPCQNAARAEATPEQTYSLVWPRLS